MFRMPVRWMLVCALALFAASAVAQEPVGCSWLTHAEADTVNVAFPDTSASDAAESFARCVSAAG